MAQQSITSSITDLTNPESKYYLNICIKCMLGVGKEVGNYQCAHAQCCIDGKGEYEDHLYVTQDTVNSGTLHGLIPGQLPNKIFIKRLYVMLNLTDAERDELADRIKAVTGEVKDWEIYKSSSFSKKTTISNEQQVVEHATPACLSILRAEQFKYKRPVVCLYCLCGKCTDHDKDRKYQHVYGPYKPISRSQWINFLVMCSVIKINSNRLYYTTKEKTEEKKIAEETKLRESFERDFHGHVDRVAHKKQPGVASWRTSNRSFYNRPKQVAKINHT